MVMEEIFVVLANFVRNGMAVVVDCSRKLLVAIIQGFEAEYYF